MSDVSVDIIKNRSGEAPDLPSGANLSGVSTAATLQVTNLNPTHINASGVTTATTFSGSLKSTGTPTLGLGVTINSSGLNISGVATAGIVSATTLYGDGSNLTGVAMSIAPISYQPDVNDGIVEPSAGIGITFTERIKAGSGNITLSVATNAGAAGTTVENFGVGSSVTIANNQIIIDPTSDLSATETYHISYPSGAFTNTAGDVSYVGTAYTFGTRGYNKELWAIGENKDGCLGYNQAETQVGAVSSPVQVPGVTWTIATSGSKSTLATKTDGTLWAWGDNSQGELGQNSSASPTRRSSPVQIPGTNWRTSKGGFSVGRHHIAATKTDGTLWQWGFNNYGQLGQNNEVSYSSPVQVPGTTWAHVGSISFDQTVAIKTDGTLWSWGEDNYGQIGLNAVDVHRSSPTQLPGTTWSKVSVGDGSAAAIKTDGTLWAWGNNSSGRAAQNNNNDGYSSPVQIPGTAWSNVVSHQTNNIATRTDGTLWTMGNNTNGQLGQNNVVQYSSPVQIPGSTWSEEIRMYLTSSIAVKTDGTLWAWGTNYRGGLGQNSEVKYSSPVQIPGTTWSWVSYGNQEDSAHNMMGKNI